MPTQTFFSLNQDKQTHIYDAALRVFTRTPYEKVSIQNILDEADIPRGSFYQYFTDKEDLYLYLCQEVDRKSIHITYRDNMDFFWNMLYTEHPEKRSSTPWYNLSAEQMKKDLSDAEYYFGLERPIPPDHLLLASFSAATRTLYPLILRHIQKDNLVDSPENMELLAFLFSSSGVLSYEYRKLTGCQPLEEMYALRKILLSFYRSVQKQTGSDADPFLVPYSSIHLLGADGVDLTAVPVPGTTWNYMEDKAEDRETDICRLQLHIQPGSLKGCFPVRTDALKAESGFISSSTPSPDMSDQIILEISGRQLTACHLCTHRIFHTLEASLTLIGTDSSNEKTVLIESGLLPRGFNQ